MHCKALGIFHLHQITFKVLRLLKNNRSHQISKLYHSHQITLFQNYLNNFLSIITLLRNLHLEGFRISHLRCVFFYNFFFLKIDLYISIKYFRILLVFQSLRIFRIVLYRIQWTKIIQPNIYLKRIMKASKMIYRFVFLYCIFFFNII